MSSVFFNSRDTRPVGHKISIMARSRGSCSEDITLFNFSQEITDASYMFLI